ncbi:MAG: hypothetical protein WBL27_06885 [Salinimicrobium sp.]
MNKKTKVKIIWYLSFFAIFLMIWTILHFSFENLDSAYKGLISGGISGLLSPRKKEFETQSGKQIQLKWIFMKKAITI